MSKKKDYLFDITPRWIKYSGLPQQLNKKYGEHAWTIFHCLIQLDCRFNPDYPDTFDQKFEEIAELVGVSVNTVSKFIRLFEKDHLLFVERGKYRGKKSRFLIVNPIKTPKHPKDIHAINGGLLNRKGEQPILRYAESPQPVGALDKEKAPNLREKAPNLDRESPQPVGHNKRKREDIKRRQQQGKGKKPDVVAPSLNQKEEKPEPITKEKLHPKTRELAIRVMKLGIKEDKALELVCSYSYNKIEDQLDWLPYRENIRNPAGALIKALEKDWPEPVTRGTGIKRRTEESLKYKRVYTGYWESQKAMLKVAKEDLKKGAGSGRIREWLDKLDPEYHEELKKFVRGLNKYKGVYE
ncbi:hypothetical protein ES702_01684 [subsurface metagenome]